MTSKFEPIQSLRDANDGDPDANIALFKNIMQKHGDRTKMYFPLETFDFPAFISLVDILKKAFPSALSLNEIGYLIYLFFWLEDQKGLANQN